MTYAYAQGSEACSECPVGRYSGGIGASECQNCAAGTESLGTGGSACISCNPGFYSLSGFSRCAPCDAGYYAPGNASSHCLACSQGHFSSQKGSVECQPCPQNTYGVSQAASSADSCRACPPGSYTRSTACVSVDECMCQDIFYRANSECAVCPVGARCDGQPVCGLNTTQSGCNIVGEWQRRVLDQYYFLLSCPSGYMLINTAEGGAISPLSAESTRINLDIQRCVKCDPDSEYIITITNSSYRFSSEKCHTCPKGLWCMGNATVAPVVEGSEWQTMHVAGLGLVYRLRSCPTGFYKSMDTEQDGTQDQCLPCSAGTECTATVCETCKACEQGYYKDTAAPEACRPCPRNTYNSEVGATSDGFCKQCPAASFTEQANSTSIEQCLCDAQYYKARDGSHRCMMCPAGAMCSGNASRVCAFGREGSECQEPVTGEWSFHADGLLYLDSCTARPGYARVNTIDGIFNYDIQTCKKCDSRYEYMIDTNLACQECPAGLECTGTDLYTARLSGSEWTLDNGQLFLTSCPSGYRMRDKTVVNVKEQQCDFCGMPLPIWLACIFCLLLLMLWIIHKVLSFMLLCSL
jgi:hypothetical protein